jgi:hypothetical protein
MQIELFPDLHFATKGTVTKVCVKCNKEYPIESFPTTHRGAYHRTECKHCTKAVQRFLKQLKKRHSYPEADYCCPICGKNATQVEGKGGKKNKPWVIDHDHVTLDFRGWLCHKCNRGLGAFDDDKQYLIRAIEYLNGTARKDYATTEQIQER